MALAYRDKNNKLGTTSNPASISFTTTTGDDLLVLMIIGSSDTPRTAGTPTWNSGAQTFTLAGSTEGAGESSCELWYLINPDIGSYSASIPNDDPFKNLNLIISAYTATNTPELFGTPQTYNSDSTTPTCTINSVPEGGLVIAGAGLGDVDAPTGRSHTVLYEIDQGIYSVNGQYGEISVEANTTMTWTQGLDQTAMVMAAFSDGSPSSPVYTKQDIAALPADDTNLSGAFTAQEYLDVATDDATRVAQTSAGQYAIFLFKDKSAYSTPASITITWNGQSDRATTTSPVYLQIYNRTDTQWDTLDTENGTGANTDFNLTANVTTNLEDYLDVNGWVACRVYQQAV